MTAERYRAHIARSRLAQEALEQQRLLNEMMQLESLQENSRPSLHSNRRPLATIHPDDNIIPVKRRHTKVNTTEMQLEEKIAALSRSAAKLAALEAEFDQLRTEMKSVEQEHTTGLQAKD
ncbi:hypothetical protein SARC_07941 [Sphaeroforma arctica JP610]|uniref:Uncharacterized protein n=1 Tax=Sphaeroforma arctica JP610 TaxID=667725 RepID=A0A0L0FSA0_9EUKA|nr:hypothetical protein SARC_07941 [Sphaeroforma arctica JP610]KNC79677.1 hypothetical protein SARC_07941 [Sphaeroforma arctica JP610]|eukprot:XP_014153579.1 hypothetical protein SARC_07941 [Sphaeroforma arctica JP610]